MEKTQVRGGFIKLSKAAPLRPCWTFGEAARIKGEGLVCGGKRDTPPGDRPSAGLTLSCTCFPGASAPRSRASSALDAVHIPSPTAHRVDSAASDVCCAPFVTLFASLASFGIYGGENVFIFSPHFLYNDDIQSGFEKRAR